VAKWSPNWAGRWTSATGGLELIHVPARPRCKLTIDFIKMCA